MNCVLRGRAELRPIRKQVRTGLHGGLLFQDSGSESERSDEREKSRGNAQIPLHSCYTLQRRADFIDCRSPGGVSAIACPEIAARIAVGSIHNSISDDPEFCRQNGDKPEFVLNRGLGERYKVGSIAAQHICCYALNSMAKKKTILDKAVDRTAEILLAHFSTLPPAEARAMRKEIHALAIKPSRSARRGKTSRSPRTAGLRRLSRGSAKPA